MGESSFQDYSGLHPYAQSALYPIIDMFGHPSGHLSRQLKNPNFCQDRQKCQESIYGSFEGQNWAVANVIMFMAAMNEDPILSIFPEMELSNAVKLFNLEIRGNDIYIDVMTFKPGVMPTTGPRTPGRISTSSRDSATRALSTEAESIELSIDFQDDESKRLRYIEWCYYISESIAATQKFKVADTIHYEGVRYMKRTLDRAVWPQPEPVVIAALRARNNAIMLVNKTRDIDGIIDRQRNALLYDGVHPQYVILGEGILTAVELDPSHNEYFRSGRRKDEPYQAEFTDDVIRTRKHKLVVGVTHQTSITLTGESADPFCHAYVASQYFIYRVPNARRPNWSKFNPDEGRVRFCDAENGVWFRPELEDLYTYSGIADSDGTWTDLGRRVIAAITKTQNSTSMMTFHTYLSKVGLLRAWQEKMAAEPSIRQAFQRLLDNGTVQTYGPPQPVDEGEFLFSLTNAATRKRKMHMHGQKDVMSLISNIRSKKGFANSATAAIASGSKKAKSSFTVNQLLGPNRPRALQEHLVKSVIPVEIPEANVDASNPNYSGILTSDNGSGVDGFRLATDAVATIRANVLSTIQAPDGWTPENLANLKKICGGAVRSSSVYIQGSHRAGTLFLNAIVRALVEYAQSNNPTPDQTAELEIWKGMVETEVEPFNNMRSADAESGGGDFEPIVNTLKDYGNSSEDIIQIVKRALKNNAKRISGNTKNTRLAALLRQAPQNLPDDADVAVGSIPGSKVMEILELLAAQAVYDSPYHQRLVANFAMEVFNNKDTSPKLQKLVAELNAVASVDTESALTMVGEYMDPTSKGTSKHGGVSYSAGDSDQLFAALLDRPLDYALVLEAVRLGLPSPFGFLIFRPHMLYYASDMAVLMGGERTGVRIRRNQEFNISKVINNRSIQIEIRLESGVIIPRPHHIRIVLAAFGKTLVRGHGVNFYDPFLDVDAIRNNTLGKDCFAFAVDPFFYPNTWSIDMTGARHPGMQVRSNQLLQYPTAAAYKEHWTIRQMERFHALSTVVQFNHTYANGVTLAYRGNCSYTDTNGQEVEIPGCCEFGQKFGPEESKQFEGGSEFAGLGLSVGHPVPVTNTRRV